MQRIGGVGLGLPLPQFKYPSEVQNAAPDIGNAYVSLPPGDSFIVPPGDYIINRTYSFVQHYDSVTGSWRGYATALGPQEHVFSDGVNVRIANLTGCPVAAIVTVGGSGYAQSTTTVTPSVGNSTWQAIVGGMLSVSTIANAGSGYGMAAELLIPQPPNPGVQATGYATMTGGSVTGVTLTNVGAGYITAPTVIVIPNPYDPQLTSTTAIVPATVTLATVGSGSVAAVICTNSGAPPASVPTLTIAGAGASAAATPVMCNTMASGSVVAAGTGLTGGAAFITSGGIPSATPQYTNPATDLSRAIPRPAQGGFAATGGSLVSVSTIYDSGLFFGTPGIIVDPLAGYIQATAGSVTLALGSVADTVLLQPL